MELSVVLPAYKEAENLVNILPKLQKELSIIEHEIVVVDTIEPTDNSERVCFENNVRYIRRENGNNYGDAIRTGILFAEGKYIIIMDADGSHKPEDAKRLYDTIVNNDCDVVIGSRYCSGGYTDNGFILKLMSRCLNIAYKVVFGLKVKDVSDSFRAYKSEQLRHLKLECDNFDIVEEILIRLNYSIKNFIAIEIPISFNKRQFGESKRDLIKFIGSYLKTMRRLLSIRKDCL